MDLQGTLAQLENAATIIMTPISNEDRVKAEEIFHTFRKTTSAFHLCSFIIENERSSEFVLFETAEVLRSNLLQEMSAGNLQEWDDLCKSLLDHLYQNPRFSYSVQRRLAGVVALILKYQSISQFRLKRAELMKYIEGMTDTDHKFFVTCSIFEALLGEHQFVANSANPVFTYETNFAAKRDFENSDLLRIFQSCLGFISSYEHNHGKERQLDRILKLLEGILFWNFSKACLPKRVASIVEMEATPTFKPPLAWGELVLSPAFIPIFFNIHVKVRADEAFVSRTLNLLLQLASLCGPLANGPDARIVFLTRLLPPIMTLLEMPYKLSAEVVGLSEVVRKILLSDRTTTLCNLEPELLNNFLNTAGNFLCLVIPQAIIEESKVQLESRIFRESATKLLEAWVNILTDVDNLPLETISPMVLKIFETFLYGHISPPEGFRSQVAAAADDLDDEDNEMDSVQFLDQLQPIGVFGRTVLSHSLPLLTSLLNFKFQAFKTKLELLASQGINQANQDLEELYEDLHWAILIAGHTIAYDGTGETNLIPTEILQFSFDSGSSPDASVQAIESALDMQVPSQVGADPICKLVSSVLYLCELERRIMLAKMTHLLSPEVTSNTLWFLNRWANMYFIFSDDHYSTISVSFSTIWADSSPTAALVQTALFRRIHQDLITYSGEECIILEALNLLHSLINSSKKSSMAMQSQELVTLIKLAGEIGPGKHQISVTMYRKFMRAMMTVGNYCADDLKREYYWDQILGSLNSRYQNFARLSSSDRHRDDVRHELAYVLSGYIGVTTSAESKVSSALFQRLAVVSSECGAILNAYHNYNDIVELCLEFINQLAKRCLTYLSRNESSTLYDAAMSVVKYYALHAKGRKSSEKNAEEDAFNDLVQMIDMLTNLLTKDFLDLSTESLLNPGPPLVSATEVCLQGLGVIIPLMNLDLLMYPNLSTKYFRMIAFLSELHPSKIFTLEPWLLQAMFQSAQIGLQKSPPECFSSCCDFISCVVNHMNRNPQQSTCANDLSKPFLKIFLEMILSEHIGRENVPYISSTLFALISAFRKDFDDIAVQLIASRESEAVRKKLTDAFTNLTVNLNMQAGGDRNSRTAFRDRLESFIFQARGCLDLIELRY